MANLGIGQVEIKSAEYTNSDGITFQIDSHSCFSKKSYEARFLGMLVERQGRVGGSQLAFKLLIANLENLSDKAKNDIQNLTEKFYVNGKAPKRREEKDAAHICTLCHVLEGDGSCCDCLEIQRDQGRYEELWGKDD